MLCYENCIDSNWPGVEPTSTRTTTSRETTTTASATRETTSSTQDTTTSSSSTESATIRPSTLNTIVPIPTSLISETAAPSIVSGSDVPTAVGSIMPTSTTNDFLSRVSSAANEAASEMASLSSVVGGSAQPSASESAMGPVSSVASIVDQATSAIQSGAEQATSAVAPGSAVTTQTPEEVLENAGYRMMPALGLTVLSVALTMFGF
ncbi:hypothetical protein HPULCUR_005850 [Helicostylum pulchrum]|uniref:Uncharacterized protein n=1 Tax=Helicostylum pulchrum TaxID=562976 RepID=A0ABP9Y1I1_9FUNG